MSWDKLSQAIGTQLESLTDYFDSDSIYDYPNFNVRGTPAVFFVPSNNSPDFDTVVNNKRIYKFLIVLLEKISEGNVKDAYAKMRLVADAVNDKFDTDPQFLSADLVLPDGYTLIDTMAAPSIWQRVLDEAAQEFLVAEIELEVYIDRQIE